MSDTPDITVEDIESELRVRIEAQAAAIQIALAYIRSGKPEIAALVLAATEETP